jgi:hypothetical protein
VKFAEGAQALLEHALQQLFDQGGIERVNTAILPLLTTEERALTEEERKGLPIPDQRPAPLPASRAGWWLLNRTASDRT